MLIRWALMLGFGLLTFSGSLIAQNPCPANSASNHAICLVPQIFGTSGMGAETLVDTGHTMQQAGDKEQAIDAYTALLYFLGPEKLPDEAKAYLTGALEGTKLQDLLDAPKIEK